MDKFNKQIRDKVSLTEFLNYAVKCKASDIILQTNETPIALVYGKKLELSENVLRPDDISQITRAIMENNDIGSTIASGRDFDIAFNVDHATEKNANGVPKKLRFRLNATGILGKGNDSMQIVLRYIPADPPSLDQIGFPDELKSEIGLKQGAFLIAGETGSGKTTTFAACLRYILEGNTSIEGNIITNEAPIEYIFSSIKSDKCIVAQSEIGDSGHLSSFSKGLINAMRRKPSLIVVGEMRDPETIMAANNAAITGHPVFGTVHANNSLVIIRRMLSLFDPSQQRQIFFDLATNCRILMSQTLVPKIGGGQVCLRDWIVLNIGKSEKLIDAGIEGHAKLLQEWQNDGENAQSMKTSIMKELSNNNITKEIADRALKKYGYL